jgi:hypothetical protein
VSGWQWASDVKKPKWRDDRQRKPGGASPYRYPPPHRPGVELINVLRQREMVEELFIRDEPAAANENIETAREEQEHPAPKAPRRFPHDPTQGQDEQPETDGADPSAHHASP